MARRRALSSYSFLPALCVLWSCTETPARTTGTAPNFTGPLSAQPCALAPDSPDREAVETRCDGIDNDCDGLVDVLLPVEANACAGSGSSCSAGFFACAAGQRVCMAAGASPEVADGVDNDCNGKVDDVAPADATSRALLLVPDYLWDDGGEEVDTMASILEQRGIAVDRPAAHTSWAAAFATLSRYALVVVPGYTLSSALDERERTALEDFASVGGSVVVIKPVEDPPGAGFPLVGAARVTRRLDVESIAFDGPLSNAARAFDSPEERSVPLANEEAYTIEPADGSVESIAHAIVHGAPAGAIVTRRKLGQGAIYALGHDLHNFGHERCYVNCFEPGADLVGLFLREALRDGTRGHFVVEHTTPGLEDSVMMLSHDVDAPDAHRAGPWGEPGAAQVASLEQQHGARGTFLVTTDYVTPYYEEDMVKTLCARGMCPLGAHSVRHADTFKTQPRGSCTETFASYYPDRTTTLCGEIRVSQELLSKVTGADVVAWRSPYLYVHDALYDVLEQQGFVADSSWAVGDLKYNLPVSLARTGIMQNVFHHRKLYTLPITAEDGIGAVVDGVETREEMQQKNRGFFRTMWSYAMLRNADNQSFTVALLHPSYGRGVGQDNLRYKIEATGEFLDAAKQRGVRMDLTMGELATFWRAREATSLDARYSAAKGYEGTLVTGAFPVTDLTLEFGDAIASFDCAECGPTEIGGRRVRLRGTLAPNHAYAFGAKPGVR